MPRAERAEPTGFAAAARMAATWAAIGRSEARRARLRAGPDDAPRPLMLERPAERLDELAGLLRDIAAKRPIASAVAAWEASAGIAESGAATSWSDAGTYRTTDAILECYAAQEAARVLELFAGVCRHFAGQEDTGVRQALR
jgi:hypothetical protein